MQRSSTTHVLYASFICSSRLVVHMSCDFLKIFNPRSTDAGIPPTAARREPMPVRHCAHRPYTALIARLSGYYLQITLSQPYGRVWFNFGVHAHGHALLREIPEQHVCVEQPLAKVYGAGWSLPSLQCAARLRASLPLNFSERESQPCPADASRRNLKSKRVCRQRRA